jgi:hypothetical protein
MHYRIAIEITKLGVRSEGASFFFVVVLRLLYTIRSRLLVFLITRFTPTFLLFGSTSAAGFTIHISLVSLCFPS